jgi:splicing factor 3A subunit 1
MEPMQTESTGRIVGVIIPPPDIRSVVDKTAQFVARNGKSFEARIQNSGEGKSSKFNFMKQYDPYHAYYELKIREFEEGVVAKPAEEEAEEEVKSSEEAKHVPAPKATVTFAAPQTSISTSVKASIVNPIARIITAHSQEQKKQEKGEGSVASSSRPLTFSASGNDTIRGAKISALDVDVIKLTAQYTAANGKDFLKGLITKEQRNPQFDFLRPTHMLFTYFTSLVDSYTLILHPTNEMKEHLQAHASAEGAKQKVLESAVERWENKRNEEERKRKETGEADAERLAFQAIDWK